MLFFVCNCKIMKKICKFVKNYTLCINMSIPKFDTQKELTEHLLREKEILIQEKRSQIKQADVVELTPTLEVTQKSEDGPLKVTVVINTSNVLDSHGDVHMNGIWNKTVKENKNPYLLQEHQMKFDKIISDKVTASVRTMNWKELGIDKPGSTDALIFEAELDAERNPFMVKQYRKGWVKNHSVGMQYVKIKLAINDPEAKEEYEEWNKTIDKIVNKEMAEKLGYYFTVYEAKMIEGSAVPIGSNTVTPTLSVQDKEIEPSADTQKQEPSEDTPKSNHNFYSFI